jgi:hypothetical protein
MNKKRRPPQAPFTRNRTEKVVNWIMGGVTKFLSYKWNLVGLYMLCSFVIGFILLDKLIFTELLIVYTLMGIMSMIVWILGVGRGMFIYAITRGSMDKMMKSIKKSIDDDKKKHNK